MSPPATRPETSKPLNARQRAFALEMGIARAQGRRSFDAEYEKAGYRRNRGNAARLAANPQVQAIANEATAKALELSGLHIGYLQAKALELLHTNALQVRRKVSETLEWKDGHVADKGLTPEQEDALFAATWAASEIKVDDKGTITVKVPDKLAVIELLAKMLDGLPDPTADAIGSLGSRLAAALDRVGQSTQAQV